MVKNFLLAAFVAVSVGGAILTSATPAAARGEEAAKEEVTFDYGGFIIEYSTQDPD